MIKEKQKKKRDTQCGNIYKYDSHNTVPDDDCWESNILLMIISEK
jgi:hypothetical protein